jgi:hypothetical protein
MDLQCTHLNHTPMRVRADTHVTSEGGNPKRQLAGSIPAQPVRKLCHVACCLAQSCGVALTDIFGRCIQHWSGCAHEMYTRTACLNFVARS